jgi:hypothetical protein
MCNAKSHVPKVSQIFVIYTNPWNRKVQSKTRNLCRAANIRTEEVSHATRCLPWIRSSTCTKSWHRLSSVTALPRDFSRTSDRLPRSDSENINEPKLEPRTSYTMSIMDGNLPPLTKVTYDYNVMHRTTKLNTVDIWTYPRNQSVAGNSKIWLMFAQQLTSVKLAG